MRLVFGFVLLIGIGLAGSAVYLAKDYINHIYVKGGGGQGSIASFRESAGSLYIILKKGGIIHLPHYVLGE